MKLQTVTSKMMRRVQKGVTMIEYALIAAVVAVGVIGALSALKGNLTSTFNSVGTQMSGAGSSTTGGSTTGGSTTTQ